MLGELMRRLQPVHVQDQEEWREVCAGLEHADQAVFYPGSALDVTPVRLLEADQLEQLMGIRRPVHRAYLFCDCGGDAAGVLQRIYSQLDRGFTADDDPDAGRDRIDIDHITQMIPLKFLKELDGEWKRSGGDWHDDAAVPWQAMYISLIAPDGREVDILFIPSDSRKVWERLIERYVGCVRWIFNLKHGGYELAEWLAQRENRCLPDFWCEDRGSAMAQLWRADSVVAQELWRHERNLRILKNPGSQAECVNLAENCRTGDEACRLRKEEIRVLLAQGCGKGAAALIEENIRWILRRMTQDGGPVRFRYPGSFDPGCTDIHGSDDRLARRADLFEAYLQRQAAADSDEIGAEAEEMLSYFMRRDKWEPGVFQAFAGEMIAAVEALFFWGPLAAYIGRWSNELEEALLDEAYRRGNVRFAHCLIENGFAGVMQTKLFSIIVKYDLPKAQDIAGRLSARCIAWILRDTCVRDVSREAELIFSCVSEETAAQVGDEIRKYRRKWPGCAEACARLIPK